MALPDDRHAIAYTAAAIYAGAIVVGLIEGIVPGGTTFANGPGFCALVMCPIAIFIGPRLPRAALAPLGPLGVVLIAWALATTHGYGDGAVLYMWPTLWMAYFFGRRGAVFVVGFIGLAHAVALLAMPAGQGNADRWVDVVVCVAVVACVTYFLSERNSVLVAELTAEARVDPLSGLLNRRGLDERMDVEVARSLREHTSVAVVMFDIDHFKDVNDEYGHEVGDRVIAWIGAVLSTEVRGADVAARIGGEEFVAMLPGVDAASGYTFAERVRDAVARCGSNDRRSDHGMPAGLALTVSAGVAAANDADGHVLMELADQALYTAKREGRNRTALAGSAMMAPITS